MKTFFSEKNISSLNENKLKKYFEIMLLVFTLTSLTIILSLSWMNNEIEAKKENTEDYVAVFKESELHEILFKQSEEQ